MRSTLKRILPLLAVAGALTVAVCQLLGSSHREGFLTDTGWTRPSVEAALAKLQGMHPASPDDETFRRALERLAREPHVATVWVLAPDGRILSGVGSTARSTAPYSTVAEAATSGTRGALDALPEAALSDEQRTMLLAASAIRRERTHNDIYRHLLRPVHGADGAVVAMIGVAYEISGGAHITPGWKATMLAAVIGLGAYWLSLPLWVLFDARDRGERAWPWTTFVLLGNVVALTAYVLARAPQARRG